MNEIFFWQETLWKKIQSHGCGQTSIFYGPKGIGHLEFILFLSKAFLCLEKNSKKPCGICKSCLLFDFGNHPDFYSILSESNSHLLSYKKIETKNCNAINFQNQTTLIKVENLRKIISCINLLSSSYLSDKRVIIIGPMESLEKVSANTLLKTLEEPLDDVFFLLFSYSIDQVLSTIKSRCQLIALPKPTISESLIWLRKKIFSNQLNIEERFLLEILKQESELPIATWERIQKKIPSVFLIKFIHNLSLGSNADWISLSKQLYTISLTESLKMIQRWLCDLILFYTSKKVKFYPNFCNEIMQCSVSLDLKEFWKYVLFINNMQYFSSYPLDNSIQLEEVFIRYKNIFRNKEK